MHPRSSRFVVRRWALPLLLGAFAVACASAPTKKRRDPADPGAEFFSEEVGATDPGLTPKVDPDSGAFGASERRAVDGGDGGSNDGGGTLTTLCDGPLHANDLHVSEIFVATRSGSNDEGEWVEIVNTRPCGLALKGVSVASPRGGAPSNRAVIAEDFVLPGHATFVVADSDDARRNNGLPGKVFTWNASDVLKNDGDTITINQGTLVIDTVTFPALASTTAGRSLAFPADCPESARADWKRWSLSFHSWTGALAALKGTPNATNDDVTCY
jgi:hypothetical protein